MRRRLILLSVCCLALRCATAWPAGASPLFEVDAPLQLNLEGPLRETFADRKQRDDHPFVLGLGGDGSHPIPIEIRVRGHSRAVACKFAPLRLDFPRKATAGTVFEGLDKLKLVLPCDGTKRAADDLLEEYAVYRIFNLLSGKSFRARLLQIDLVDNSARGGPALHGYAFLIEPDAALAERIGLAEVALPAVRRDQLDPEQAATMYIFQYMVGNTDWSLAAPSGATACCHNVRLFGDTTRLFTVPYDFDQTGLVNASYAEPNPALRLSGVTQRLYRGYCLDPAVLGQALDRIVAQRAAILDVLTGLENRGGRSLAGRSRYLEGFFKQAGHRERLLGQFADRCL